MKTPARLFLASILFAFLLFRFSNIIRAQDATPPVISNLNAAPSSDSAVITWTTDEPATSSVDWGTTPVNDFTSNDFALVTSHSVTLSNLSNNTLYYYAVFTSD